VATADLFCFVRANTLFRLPLTWGLYASAYMCSCQEADEDCLAEHEADGLLIDHLAQLCNTK